MKRITILLGAFLMVSNVFAQGITFFEGTWEEALATAKEENKSIFVDTYTDWCAPCKKMSKYVFTKPQVGNFYNAEFINVKLNMEKGEGVDFAKTYEVRAYPTLLYFSPEGELVHRTAGFRDANKFLALGKEALDPNKRLSTLTKKYAAGDRSPEFLRNYAYAAKAAVDPKYPQIAEEYLKTQNQWNSPETMQFIYDFTESTRSRQFNYMVENRAMFEEAIGKGEMFGKIQSIVQERLDLIMNQKSATNEIIEVGKLFDKVYQEEATVKFAAFKMTYYRTQGDRDGFAEAAVDYVDNMRNITADELNSIARTFAEVIDDKGMLEKAVDWTKRAIDMESDFTYHYTLGALYYKLNKKRKAKKATKKAIKIGKKDSEDIAPVEELLKQIKSGKKYSEQ